MSNKDEDETLPKKTKPGSEHREMLKKEFLEVYESQPGKTIQEAANQIGPDDVHYTPRTIWQWGRDDPTFKRDIETAQARKLQWMHDTALSKNFRQIDSGEAKVRETTNFLKYLDKLKEKQAADKEDLLEGDSIVEIGEKMLRVMFLKKGVDVEDDESIEDVVEAFAKKSKKIEDGSKED